ncbi:MAG TPA: hypothetical protein VFQ35_17860 [Polyangiaceae bacterium]|nr:hypothetical protein [Polyangiaceae bacterium]
MIEHRSVAALCTLAAVPATLIAATAWIWQPSWALGRALVTACLAALFAALWVLAAGRRRTIRVERGSTLTWETGIESDDPYGVALHQNGVRELVIENNDPARVLADARRLARETGAVLLGPEWIAGRRTAPRDPSSFPAISAEGLVWPAQLRASRTSVLAGLFVLVLSAGSIRAESEVSLLSAALPGFSVVLALLIGALLAKLRVVVEASPAGLRAERRGVGAPRTLLNLPLESVLDVNAVGHPSHPETHLLIETVDGPVALTCAEETARGVARTWASSRRASGAA